MSWLRSTNFHFNRQSSKILDPKTDYEPSACYNSFCKHWQQAYDTINKTQPNAILQHDSALAVINHLEHLSTLLHLEAKGREIFMHISNNNPTSASCLEFVLCENLLDKLYEWSICTGKYENAVRLEQLKLYYILINNYGSHVMGAEPFLRPLLKLLVSCRSEILSPDVEAQLVLVLSQLCITLMQNINYIDLFFLTTPLENSSVSEFIIVRLLLGSVHREGSIGAVSRDALLLCATMSCKHQQLADYMLNSDMCIVLATGLSGLYSSLPRRLLELGNTWHRLTPDDVNSIGKLALFITSQEFCNAVIQVAHPSIKRHLIDYLYRGFLVPVMGPALLQRKMDSQSGRSDRVAAVAYLEATVRALTPRGALPALLKFLTLHTYDGEPLINILLNRINGTDQLSLVTLSLMETLVELNCEDIMLNLVYKHLLASQQVLQPYIKRLNSAAVYRNAAKAFLELSPMFCTRQMLRGRGSIEDGNKSSDTDEESWRSSTSSSDQSVTVKTDPNVRLGINPNETLMGNYHAYICDSGRRIQDSCHACSNWTSKYDGVQTNEHTPLNKNNSGEMTSESRQPDSLTSIGESSGYESFKYRPEADFCDETEDNTDDCEYAEVSFLKEIIDTEDVYIGSEKELATRQFQLNVGPFLSMLLWKMSSLLECDIHMSVRLTSIVSKLCVLPTTLTMSLLLLPDYPLHTNVPTLFQTLRRLKSELDELSCDGAVSSALVEQARCYLIQRELLIANFRHHSTTPNDNNTAHSDGMTRIDADTFKRHEQKKKSNTFTSMLAKKLGVSGNQHMSTLTSTNNTHNSDIVKYPYLNDSYWDKNVTRRSILNAVILDEWLKELSSIAYEHSLRLAITNYDSTLWQNNPL